MVDRRTDSLSALSRRIRRLEAIVAVIVASGNEDDLEFPDELAYLFRRLEDDDEVWGRRFPDFLFRYARGRRGSSDLREQVGALQRSADKVQTRLARIEEDSKDQRQDLHAFLYTTLLEVPNGDLPLHRYVPVRFYTTSEHANEAAVTEAVEKFLGAFDFVVADNLPGERGSLFKRFFARTKEVATKPEVASRIAKAERALELKMLHERQANVDKLQAEAVAVLLKAIENDDNAALQVGSLLLLRTKTASGQRNTVTRTLTQRELIFVEQNQQLLKRPENLLDKLATFNCHQGSADKEMLLGAGDQPHGLLDEPAPASEDR